MCLYLCTKFQVSRIILEISEYLSLFSPNAGKFEPEKTPYLDTFHAVPTETIVEHTHNCVFLTCCKQDLNLWRTRLSILALSLFRSLTVSVGCSIGDKKELMKRKTYGFFYHVTYTFRVYVHSLIAWMPWNTLLEIDAIVEI